MESQLPEPSSNVLGPRKPIYIITIALILIIFLSAAVFYYLKIQKTNPLTNVVNNQSNTAKAKLVFTQAFISPSQIKSDKTEIFSCPILTSFCSDNQSFKGLFMSGNLSANILFFAAFDGDLIQLISYHTNNNTKEQFTTLILINKEKGLIAYYRFKGTGADKKSVTAGDSIGTTNGQPLSFYNYNSFAFEVNRITAENSEVVILKKENFK